MEDLILGRILILSNITHKILLSCRLLLDRPISNIYQSQIGEDCHFFTYSLESSSLHQKATKWTKSNISNLSSLQPTLVFLFGASQPTNQPIQFHSSHASVLWLGTMFSLLIILLVTSYNFKNKPFFSC